MCVCVNLTSSRGGLPSDADKVDKEWEWQLKLSLAGYALERDMYWAMRNFWESDSFVFLVCDSYWIPRWDDK
jgi:hypothetical protein